LWNTRDRSVVVADRDQGQPEQGHGHGLARAYLVGEQQRRPGFTEHRIALEARPLRRGVGASRQAVGIGDGAGNRRRLVVAQPIIHIMLSNAAAAAASNR
jgi:hypothetical protein